MDELNYLIDNVVNRTVPDRGQVMSNYDMFGQILKYTQRTEMYILEDIDYAYMFANGQNNGFDAIAQMLAFLQMTCFREIDDSGILHNITEITMRWANAELWHLKFRNRISKEQNFYIH